MYFNVSAAQDNANNVGQEENILKQSAYYVHFCQLLPTDHSIKDHMVLST